MEKVSRSAAVPYSAKCLYDLVNDVESYPQFLPWCGGAKILEKSSSEIVASVEISKGAMRKTFTTQNTLHPHDRIEMKLVSGPFKTLHGIWQFEALDENTCRVSLDLEFDFSNRVIAMVVGPVFHHIANTLLDAFVERAHQVCETPDGDND